MSISAPAQGHTQSTVTSSQQSQKKPISTADVQAQLREIGQKRVAYKEYQARVQAGRAKREALLSETASCTKDLENIEAIDVYVRRKIEFYTVAAGALQREIEEARSDAGRRLRRRGPTDYLNEEWLAESNADLLADITVESVIAEVVSQETRKEIERRDRTTAEYRRRRAEMENRTEQCGVWRPVRWCRRFRGSRGIGTIFVCLCMR